MIEVIEAYSAERVENQSEHSCSSSAHASRDEQLFHLRLRGVTLPGGGVALSYGFATCAYPLVCKHATSGRGKFEPPVRSRQEGDANPSLPTVMSQHIPDGPHSHWVRPVRLPARSLKGKGDGSHS